MDYAEFIEKHDILSQKLKQHHINRDDFDIICVCSILDEADELNLAYKISLTPEKTVYLYDSDYMGSMPICNTEYDDWSDLQRYVSAMITARSMKNYTECDKLKARVNHWGYEIRFLKDRVIWKQKF